MFIVQRTFTRPNVNVEFYANNADFTKHWNENYKGTKVASTTVTLSDDKLTKTYVWVYANEAAFNAAGADPVITANWAARDEYNTANGISDSGRKTAAI